MHDQFINQHLNFNEMNTQTVDVYEHQLVSDSQNQQEAPLSDMHVILRSNILDAARPQATMTALENSRANQRAAGGMH